MYSVESAFMKNQQIVACGQYSTLANIHSTIALNPQIFMEANQ